MLSKITYTGNGTADTFSVPFSYLNRQHLAVLVDGVPVTPVFVSNSSVRIVPAPANGVPVVIQRFTPVQTLYTSFSDATNFVAADLNNAQSQSLFLIQELRDSQQVLYSYVTNAVIGGDLALPPANAPSVLVYMNEEWGPMTVASFAAMLVNPPDSPGGSNGVGTASKYIRVEERKPYNQYGGAYVDPLTWKARALSDIIVDETNAVTLAGSGRMTIPGGKYRVSAKSSYYLTGRGLMRIASISGSTQTALAKSITAASYDGEGNLITLDGQFTVNTATQIELQIAINGYGEANQPDALGLPHNWQAAGDNIYSVLELWKIA